MGQLESQENTENTYQAAETCILQKVQNGVFRALAYHQPGLDWKPCHILELVWVSGYYFEEPCLISVIVILQEKMKCLSVQVAVVCVRYSKRITGRATGIQNINKGAWKSRSESRSSQTDSWYFRNVVVFQKCQMTLVLSALGLLPVEEEKKKRMWKIQRNAH